MWQAGLRGTPTTVTLILEKLGAGLSPEAIIADYPRLTQEDLYAALAYAADQLR